MESPDQANYEFGPYALDARERWLKRDGQLIALTPRAFDTLLLLVRNSGHLVTREELMSVVWGGAFVEEGNLTVTISMLRKALSDGAGETAFIETVPKLGYRFVPQVRVTAPPPGTLVLEKHTRTRIIAEEEIEDTPAARPVRLDRLAAVALTAALVVGAAFFGWRWAAPPAVSPAPLRVTPFASFTQGVQTPSFSPDGSRIAFAWQGPDGKNWDIYVETIGNDPPLRLTTSAPSDICPAWSPEGRQIAFLRDQDAATGLFVIGALGGAERKLLDLAANRYFDLDWIAFAEKTDPSLPWDNFRTLAVFLLDVNTLEKRQLTFPSASASDNRFAFSPDGRTLAFMRHEDIGTGFVTSLLRVPVDGGDPVRVHEERNWMGHLAWSPDGQSIIFTSQREGGSKLYRISVGGGVPEPLPFAEDQVSFPVVSAGAGRLAYVRHYDDSDLWRVDLTAPRGMVASSAPFISTVREETAPEFSPDGRRLAFFSDNTGRRELWLANADGTGATALTEFQASSSFAPRWSPDGAQMAFDSAHGPGQSGGGVFVLDVESRAVRRLTDAGFSQPSWSRDGQWLYVTAAPQRGAYQLWKLPAAGGPAVQVTKNGGLAAQESLDGRSLYYTKRPGGIWVMPVSGGDETQVLPFPEAQHRGFWRLTADGIIFLRSSNRSDGHLEFFDFSSRRSQRLGGLPEATSYGGGIAVSPDGRRIVYSRVARSGDDIMLAENFR
jgi:Tol biopolymer transport system component/DNA-binding winged helix-turn-helix (wHTH) protein